MLYIYSKYCADNTAFIQSLVIASPGNEETNYILYIYIYIYIKLVLMHMTIILIVNST